MCVHLCTRFQVSRIILSGFRQGGGVISPRLGLSLKDYWNYLEEKRKPILHNDIPFNSHKMNTTLTVAKHSKRTCLLYFLTCHFFLHFYLLRCFLVTHVSRFALLPYYRRFQDH